MNKQRQAVVWASSAALAGALGWLGWRVFKEKSAEEPSYRVLGIRDGVEVRQYGPSVVASTQVEGTFEEMLETGFRRLAGYIFGGNRRKQSIAMTAPVTLKGRGATRRMSFVMPSEQALETLPSPVDAQIRLEAVPGRRVAVRSFSGAVTESLVEAEEARLLEDLRRQGLRPMGVPVLAQYNSPLVPSFLRRNELLIEVESVEPVH